MRNGRIVCSSHVGLNLILPKNGAEEVRTRLFLTKVDKCGIMSGKVGLIGDLRGVEKRECQEYHCSSVRNSENNGEKVVKTPVNPLGWWKP